MDIDNKTIKIVCITMACVISILTILILSSLGIYYIILTSKGCLTCT